MNFLPDEELERSAGAANCRMNRERCLASYERELGFDPIDFLKNRPTSGRSTTWLDLCCGSGKALIEAATLICSDGLNIEVIGLDLVGMFRVPEPDMTCLRLVLVRAVRVDARHEQHRHRVGLAQSGTPLEFTSWIATNSSGSIRP